MVKDDFRRLKRRVSALWRAVRKEVGKTAYVERNRHMIDRADLCVFCYDENYKPPLACGARGRAVCDLPKSGTKVAYEYAVKRKKEIVNVVGHR